MKRRKSALGSGIKIPWLIKDRSWICLMFSWRQMECVMCLAHFRVTHTRAQTHTHLFSAVTHTVVTHV